MTPWERTGGEGHTEEVDNPGNNDVVVEWNDSGQYHHARANSCINRPVQIVYKKSTVKMVLKPIKVENLPTTFSGKNIFNGFLKWWKTTTKISRYTLDVVMIE